MSAELRSIVKSSKFFYRDHYHRMCNLLVGALAIILLLVLSIIYVYMTRGLPDFYADSSNGELTQIPAMPTPNYSHNPLIQ